MNLYAFDQVADSESAAASEAAKLLAGVADANSAAASFYSRMLSAVEQISAIMLRVLGMSFRTDKGRFRELRDSVSEARRSIPVAAGMDSSAMNEACDQLDLWLNNLQRLARPSKKDLGVYGGFVACVMFCVVLVIVVIVDRAFSLHASATVIFSTCTTLGVLAGFGLAGLKALRSSAGQAADAGG
jgi:hypothetical protein